MTRIWGTCTAATAVILAAGYALGGYWAWSVVWIALSGLWWLGRRHWKWTGSVLLFIYVMAAVVGLWANFGAAWMLAGTVVALVAWDLDHFTEQIQGVDRVVQKRTLVRTHLRRLALVSGAGLLLGGVALLVQIQLSLGVALLLGLLAVIGLRQFLAALRRESD